MSSEISKNISITAFRSAVGRIRSARGKAERDRLAAFRAVRDRLKSRVLDAFQRDELPGFRQMNEILEKGHGLPVPFLSICGHGTAEIRFTKLLAWFLDSRNPHGLGGHLAEAIFDREFPSINLVPSFENCTAEAEIELGEVVTRGGDTKGNSLDIMVRAGNWLICIEQKILSAEGKDQLSNYRKRLRAKYPDKRLLLFYLTPDGKSGSEKDWLPMSYRTLFGRMSDVLISRALFPTARHNLRALLWDLMLGPIAQDDLWVKQLRIEVKRVVEEPERYFTQMSRWFARQGMDQNERRLLIKLVEV